MKERTKKIILLISILLIFCLLLFTIKYLFKKEKTIKGTLVTDYIYQYVLDKPNEYVPIIIINDNIYTLTNNEKTYSLYKRNIYSEDNILVGTIENQDFCSFDELYIICSNNKVDYYDFDLNLLHSRIISQDENIDSFYYQGKFLTLKNNKIYDNDTLIRELNIDSNTFLNDSHIIDNNTYLKFYSRNSMTYINYDVQNDKYIELNEPLWSKYNNGYYTSLRGNIKSYNLITNNYTEYNNLDINEYIIADTLNNNTYYYIDNNKLHSIDLDTKTINIYDYIFDNNITQIVYNNYLYLISYDEEINIYLIDINKIQKTSYKEDEYKTYLSNEIDKKVKELENNYNINIVYKNEVNIDNDTFKTTVMNNNITISKSLNTIEKILNKFNKPFFDQFHDEEHDGIIMYLSGEIIPNIFANTTSYPIGYSLTENNQFEIVLDIRSTSLDETVCHELMHNIEFRMNKDIYTDWFNLNPIYFEYMYSYKENADNDFTPIEENPYYVYFVSSYSKSYPTEDIATIFENICSQDNNTIINDYPHLYDKAIYLKETLETEFPSLKEATVFNSLKEKID